MTEVWIHKRSGEFFTAEEFWPGLHWDIFDEENNCYIVSLHESESFERMGEL